MEGKSLVFFEFQSVEARSCEGMVAETDSERKFLRVLVRCWLCSEFCCELVSSGQTLMGSPGLTVIITSIPSEFENIQCGGHKLTTFGCLLEPQSTGRGMPPVATSSDVVASAFKRTASACPRSPSMLALGWGSGVHAFSDPLSQVLAVLIFFTCTPLLVRLLTAFPGLASL